MSAPVYKLETILPPEDRAKIGPNRLCDHCGRTSDGGDVWGGPDPCLGHLEGITSACCGHGELNENGMDRAFAVTDELVYYGADEAREFLRSLGGEPPDLPPEHQGAESCVIGGITTDPGPSPPAACSSCPWRVENWTDKPSDRPEEWYTPEARAGLWRSKGGLGESGGQVCHRFEVTDRKMVVKARHCRGGVALQQRAAIRWLTGTPVMLRAPEALVAMFPDEDEQRMAVAAPLKIIADMLGLDFKQLEMFSRGISEDEVIAAAVPEVFDPNIACEDVPAPTEEEIAEWREAARRWVAGEA